MQPNTIILIVAAIAGAVWLWQAGPGVWAWIKAKFQKSPVPGPDVPADLYWHVAALREALPPALFNQVLTAVCGKPGGPPP